MRNRLQTAFAVVAGLLLLTTAALGGAMMQPGVDSLDDATGEYVEKSEGQVLVGGAALAVGIAAGAGAGFVYDNYIQNSPDTEELAKTDALETHKEIYDQASIQKQNNELTSTAYNNYLNDTESIALMEGKNAYIRALENGSAESVARNRATEAVADYYSTKQKNVVAAWNTSVILGESMQATVENTSGLSSGVVYLDAGSNIDYTILQFANTTKQYTLANGSQVSVPTVLYSGPDGNAEGTAFDDSISYAGVSHTLHGLVVNPPTDNQDALEFVDGPPLHNRWTEIHQQNDEVQSQLDTFIDNTYSSYQQGEINTSDLVDPYLGAREFSPETSNTWTLRTLSAMGVDPPENLSNIGRMNVTANGQKYTGVLMSDGTPEGGYTVGETYHATNLTGAQFVATDDGGAVELDGTFTLDSARTADGEVYQEGDNVTYQNITYQTANTSEFKALQDQLDGLTAEINARQQRQRNAGGGGLLPDFGQGGAIPGAVLIAGAAAFLLTRD